MAFSLQACPPRRRTPFWRSVVLTPGSRWFASATRAGKQWPGTAGGTPHLSRKDGTAREISGSITERGAERHLFKRRQGPRPVIRFRGQQTVDSPNRESYSPSTNLEENATIF